MDRQFELRMAEIDNVLLQMEQRGHVYFDDMLRIGRVFDLLNKARVQEGFERDVVADAPVQIERGVSELIDWMVGADLRQWQQVNAHLADRRRQYRDRIVGDPELATFHVERGAAASSPSAARRSASSTASTGSAKRRRSPRARATPWPPRRPSAPGRSGSAPS